MQKTLTLLLFCLTLTGCSSSTHCYNVVGADEFVIDSHRIRQGKLAILEMIGEEKDPLPYDALEEYEDTIAEGDRLTVTLYHPAREELSQAFSSMNNALEGFPVIQGDLTLPDLPPVKVVGLTLMKARAKILEEIRHHYGDADLFLAYRARIENKVELAGNVVISSIPVDGRIRLHETLSKAQIAPSANLFMSHLIREGHPLAVDFHRLMNQGDMTHNVVMRPGDRIFIANSDDAVVMVMGEVFSPTAIPVRYGSISLPEAIVRARGIPYTGDRCRIQVIRGDLLCPKIYILSWEHIVNLPNRSLLLMPGDTVYVTEKPITQWNRFISQLAPSFGGLRDAQLTYRMLR